jgi:hypothetical protein
VRIQIIHDQDDPLGIGIVDLDQVLDTVRPVHNRPSLRRDNMPRGPERLIPEEEVGDPSPFILVVLSGGCPGTWTLSSQTSRLLVAPVTNRCFSALNMQTQIALCPTARGHGM